MAGLAFNAVDIIVLLLVAVLAALALRSIVRGGALDCSTCTGDCSGCGGTCRNPKLKLTKEQLAQLEELDREYGVSK